MSRSDRRDHCVGSGSNPSFLPSRFLECFFFVVVICLFVSGIENVDYFLFVSPQAAAGLQRKVT